MIIKNILRCKNFEFRSRFHGTTKQSLRHKRRRREFLLSHIGIAGSTPTCRRWCMRTSSFSCRRTFRPATCTASGTSNRHCFVALTGKKSPFSTPDDPPRQGPHHLKSQLTSTRLIAMPGTRLRLLCSHPPKKKYIPRFPPSDVIAV